ncbi:double-stranded RNA-binding protein 1-like isoform X2 [Malania oleifera]|uniref:double-stranded RNA-binding protein 1-like isoform X2 n=1 Tax=Malania oleifera TaxID=397392 RepID=UPI0025ADA461|nr:double-stranded RNA-binding protein 1-like isoform X2 [Malania oleifera]
MYKSKLQELCHRFSWQLPEYSYEKEGPNHNPHFTASVTVNGRSFRTPDHYSSSKLAQNEVAKLAILHLTDPQPSLPPATPSTVSAPSASSGHLSAGTGSEGTLPIRGTFQPKIPETLQNPQTNGTTSAVGDDKRSIALTDVHMYKNKLQNYAQKRNLTLPIYSCEHKGPPHDSRFKCKVTVDGQTFESPDFFHTVKEAKHAAAKVALMSLSTDGIQEDDSGFYKNLLQGLAQKEGFVLPIYDTNISGLSHKPTFVSTVKIGGEIFQGQEAKTKKQAEVSAAKVAYTTLTERKPSSPKFAPCSCIEAGPSSSSMSISDLEENVRHIAIEEQYDDYRGCVADMSISNETKNA